MGEIVNGNPVNETHANVKRSRSIFPLKQMILDTHRFGEIHPHLVIDGVTSDKLPFHSSHSARSYTLKAPLMQDIQMHKDYFMVTLRSILPLQADRIITNPTIGDDVPSDAYTNVSGFISKIKDIHSEFVSMITTEAAKDTPDINLINTLFLKKLVLLEAIFSNGSLLASLGCNLSTCCNVSDTDSRVDLSIDDFVDLVFRFISSEILTKNLFVTIDSVTYKVVVSYPERIVASQRYLSLRDFLSKIRDTSDWSISASTSASFSDLSSVFEAFPIGFLNADYDVDLDLARLWAYHLVCAEYYSNDKVDYIYSAELFRQYIYSLFTSSNSGLVTRAVLTFSWNGSLLPYDYLSAHFFNVLHTYRSTSLNVYSLQYYLTLFGYHRSLRYKDYFTGSRTRPLAVGDTSIPVVSNSVSVIDVSRNIQMQRFLNAVNATGRKFGEYLKGIFGVAPAPDMHNPIFLAHTSDSIFASEVENTGDAQWDAESETGKNSVTAVFRGNSNRFAFEIDVNEPCIILGVTCYDIERAYIHGIERSFFTKDRYDMFLPQLQYVGDQPVYQKELAAAAQGSTFGYQFRDMDRKQLVNRAVGGFASDVLPGYSFVYNEFDLSVSPVISPDFIRSRTSELDQFYLSLTGYSLGTYFHFIVLNNNMCKASRPMAYNPQILG